MLAAHGSGGIWRGSGAPRDRDAVDSAVGVPLADIIAVPGDPLSDIRQTEKVFFVMRDGKVVRNSR